MVTDVEFASFAMPADIRKSEVPFNEAVRCPAGKLLLCKDCFPEVVLAVLQAFPEVALAVLQAFPEVALAVLKAFLRRSGRAPA